MQFPPGNYQEEILNRETRIVQARRKGIFPTQFDVISPPPLIEAEGTFTVAIQSAAFGASSELVFCMISFFSILFLGFFLGMRHATDADHVVAVTNIVSQQRSIRSAAWTGVMWGIGHSLTVFVVGAAIACFGFVVSKRMGLSLELSVGIMLIVLGLLNLNATFRWFGEARHGHKVDGVEGGQLDRWLRVFAPGSPFRPLVIGIVHGLAGSAAVALLVLPLMHDAFGAITYLLIFGVGTVAGMMIVTAAIAAPIRYAAEHSANWHRVLGGLAGATSFCLGAFLVYQIGFVQKLFLTGL